jgi:hypothetical protein
VVRDESAADERYDRTQHDAADHALSAGALHDGELLFFTGPAAAAMGDVDNAFIVGLLVSGALSTCCSRAHSTCRTSWS